MKSILIKFDLPEWATFVAMDDDGRWHAFDEKPLTGIGMWLAHEKKHWLCQEPVGKKATNWKKTLTSV